MLLVPFLLSLAAPVPVADVPAPATEQSIAVPGGVIVAPPPEVEGANQTAVIEQQVMIRVPASRSQVVGFSRSSTMIEDEPVAVDWREVKAPRCIPMRQILGVQYTQKSSIDLITRERQRIRAGLDSECRAADFYSGFYMSATKDGNLCANRDMIHARSGARCDVNKFTQLVPVPRER